MKLFNKSAMCRVLGVILIFSISLCIFSGCKAANEEEKEPFVDKGIESGFVSYVEPGWHVPASPSWNVAVKSDVSIFPINDVTLDFYFGICFDESVEVRLELGRPVWGPLDIFFTNESETKKILIKQTEENFTSDKYRMDTEWYPETCRYVDVFNHHEMFTIPEELFDSDSGKIYFICGGEIINDDSDEYTEIMPKLFYYKKIDGNRVRLSSKNDLLDL